MEKDMNPNAPKKGVRKTVEPIRKMKDIRNIVKILEDKPRDQLLFVLGINNGLRTCDIIKLRVRDVRFLDPGGSITIIESKRGKANSLKINEQTYKCLHKYLHATGLRDDEYLFKSQKGGHISIPYINELIKSWASAVNLKGRYGAHSLRKTWGYIQRTVHGTSFELICKRYKHASPAVTMTYLGIEAEEVEDILSKPIAT